MKRILGALCLVIGLSGIAQAQLRQADLDFSRLGQAAYYKYAESGDVTIVVNAWGTVRFPGRYEITRGSDLGDLVSLAGGPNNQALDPTAVERTITIKLSRNTGNGREIVYDSVLDNIVENNQVYPVLQEGDVLLIETLDRQKFRLRDIIPMANFFATMGLIVVRIVELRN